MANTIQFKRGTGVPSGLNAGEPAFDITNKKLYVGTGSESVEVSSSFMPIAIYSQTTNQNVGGSNGTEVVWEWQTIEKEDAGYTLSTSAVTIATDGWYEINLTANVMQTGNSRSTLQGFYRINGGTSIFNGTVRDYSRGAVYGNLTAGLSNIIQLTAGDYIEVGTRIEDTDGVYVINTIASEVTAGESRLILKKIQ